MDGTQIKLAITLTFDDDVDPQEVADVVGQYIAEDEFWEAAAEGSNFSGDISTVEVKPVIEPEAK